MDEWSTSKPSPLPVHLGEEGGMSPSGMKSNTSQRQRPTCTSVVATSWKGSPQTADPGQSLRPCPSFVHCINVTAMSDVLGKREGKRTSTTPFPLIFRAGFFSQKKRSAEFDGSVHSFTFIDSRNLSAVIYYKSNVEN